MSSYTLGHSADEQDRLQQQAGYLREITRAIWRSAGIVAGMRVLDVGCGVGDTSFLAADLVGPAGFVIGQDRSAEAIATARRRAAAEGRTNILFVQGELGTLPADQAGVDAVVGRYILIHQPDIVEALRRVHALLPHGGIAAFHEIEFDVRARSEPNSDLALEVRRWIREAFRLGGVQLRAVSQFSRWFFEAGFGWPETQLHPLVGCGPDSFAPGYLVATLRTLAPLLIDAGAVTADELGLDTLEARLRASCANGAPALMQINGGAWARRS